MHAKLITVFGGSGFIGKQIVQYLVRAGVRVRVAVRSSFQHEESERRSVEYVTCDVTNSSHIAEAIQGSKYVVNLVGILYEKGNQKFDAIHHGAAEQIAKLSTEAKVEHLIHMSALGADPNSSSKYAKSKGMGELAVQKNFNRATILRPSVVFGKNDQFFNLFAEMALWSPFLPVFGEGKNLMQPVYVNDIAEVVIKILEELQFRGKIYELGGPDVVSFKQLMQLILKEINRKRLVLPIPYEIGSLMGKIMQVFPDPPLTADQILLLRRDNIVSNNLSYKTFKDLGITPTAINDVIPQQLSSYSKRFPPI